MLECDGISVIGVAFSGDEAIRLAETLAPDFALVDITLGDDSGFEVADRLANGADSEVPAVILISAHDEWDFSAMIERSSARGFIAKANLSTERIRELLSD